MDALNEKRAVSRRSRAAMLAAVLACVALVALVCWGCAPTPTTQAAVQEAKELSSTGDDAALAAYPDFTENSSGMFPDTYTNTDLLNAGNRGCNACHSDLFETIKQKEGYNHILVSTGFDKNGTYKDCEPCHRTHMMLTGPYLGDLLHASHYSTEAFVENNGNCWSCHAVDSEGDMGDYQFKLWDDLYDTAAVGGWVTASNDTSVRTWAEGRGFKNGLITEFSVEAEPSVDVTFDQEACAEDDVFVVNNWGPEVTEKNGEPFSFDAVCDENNAVTISGVKSPKTFTKADLEAMPQTEFTMNIGCGTNGSGGALTANVPMTGVSMEYIIEQCGGLIDGANGVLPTSYDGWVAMGIPLQADAYTRDAYLVTKHYGHDLTDDQGGPIMVVSKGGPGVLQVKHIKSIEFMAAEDPFLEGGVLGVNGLWFQNNGNTYKLGETIELSAAAYSYNRAHGDLKTVSFSFDMGMTWLDYDLDSVISGYDPYQWARATIKWTPTEAGTYGVLMSGTTATGEEMADPVALILTVQE